MRDRGSAAGAISPSPVGAKTRSETHGGATSLLRDVESDAVWSVGLRHGGGIRTIERSRGDGEHPRGWICKTYYGLDQGPIILMIENFRSGLLPWRLMRRCPHIVTGLLRAGFQGGWLGGHTI